MLYTKNNSSSGKAMDKNNMCKMSSSCIFLSMRTSVRVCVWDSKPVVHPHSLWFGDITACLLARLFVYDFSLTVSILNSAPQHKQGSPGSSPAGLTLSDSAQQRFRHRSGPRSVFTWTPAHTHTHLIWDNNAHMIHDKRWCQPCTEQVCAADRRVILWGENSWANRQDDTSVVGAH